jgi:hypothetical protein
VKRLLASLTFGSSCDLSLEFGVLLPKPAQLVFKPSHARPVAFLHCTLPAGLGVGSPRQQRLQFRAM